MLSFEGVGSLVFCEEARYYVRNNYPENAHYYFCIGVPIDELKRVTVEFGQLLERYGIYSTFTPAELVRESSARQRLIASLTNFIIDHRLHSYCCKGPTELQETRPGNRILPYLVPGLEGNAFRPLLQWVTILRDYWEAHPKQAAPAMIFFFDKEHYPTARQEEYGVERDPFVKQICFSDRRHIRLLGLASFLACLFEMDALSELRSAGLIHYPGREGFVPRIHG